MAMASARRAALNCSAYGPAVTWRNFRSTASSLETFWRLCVKGIGPGSRLVVNVPTYSYSESDMKAFAQSPTRGLAMVDVLSNRIEKSLCRCKPS